MRKVHDRKKACLSPVTWDPDNFAWPSNSAFTISVL